MDDDDDRVWGTAPADAPVTRADFERALCGLNVNALALREQHLELVAQVAALTEALARGLPAS